MVSSSESDKYMTLASRAYEQTLLAFSIVDSPIQILLHSYNGRNAAVDNMATRLPSNAVGCKKGCSACCHQMVMARPFEVFLIAKVIQEKWSAVEQEELKLRLRSRIGIPLNAQSRYGKMNPCALLRNSACGIYEFRPLVCRTVFSRSRKQCDDALELDGGQIDYLADPIPFGQALDLGVTCAIYEKWGLDLRRVELEGSLLTALEDFEGTVLAWFDRQSPFEDFVIDHEEAKVLPMLLQRIKSA